MAAADIPPLTNNQKSRSKFLQELIAVLKSYGDKWKEMLVEVEYQMTDGTKKSPEDTHLVFWPSQQPEDRHHQLYAD